MFRVRVDQWLEKPIDAVFEALSDHAAYGRFPGVDRAELLEPGTGEKNGEGAVRKVIAGPLQFIERIGTFERPTRMCYRIEASKPLTLRHDRGEITLTGDGNRTHVLWVSEGHAEVPLIGSVLIDPLFERKGHHAFAAILRYIEAH